MNTKTIEYQAREYLFDLNNAANENGFKADEHWKVSLATAAEKAAIERSYYPTISTKVVPEVLPELFRIVKATLSQGLDNLEKIMDANTLAKNQLQYVIAYNPNRLRR
ncbi:hypothetical protein [Mucilaginibacter sp.]|jgi:hypothetical protein|uniref:hypothetical protein n=1 Tax=Mucilaginibacter sp. TaxID=1882438 RepID=UPI0035662146